MPPGVISCLTGSGKLVGDGAASTTRTSAGATFTGSFDVGFGQLYKKFSREFPKPCIVEMGGKNPAIVMRQRRPRRGGRGRVPIGVRDERPQVLGLLARLRRTATVADEFLDRLQKHDGGDALGDPLDKRDFSGRSRRGPATTTTSASCGGARGG